MSWFKSRRGDTERQLDDEFRFHIERLVDEYVGQGMSAEAARRKALVEFGGTELAKEECRDVQGWFWIEVFLQDLRYAGRVLRRSPMFTLAAVLSLALGIGANTAVFSVIDALLLRKLPVKNPGQLVAFHRTFEADGGTPFNFEFSWFERYRLMTDQFAGVSAIFDIERTDADTSSQFQARLVTGNYFTVLGVEPLAGRTLTEDDDRVPGAHPVAVISYAYWQRRFGGFSRSAAEVVGRTLRLNRTNFTVVGVTPPGFSGEWTGQPADVWFPLTMIGEVISELPRAMPDMRRGMSYYVIARLPAGVPRERATAAGQVVYQQILREARGGPNASQTVRQRIERARFELTPAATGFSKQREAYTQPLAILSFIAGFILLIACANVANLLLARSAARQREIAVRVAIGAGRARIARQLLTEGAVLATLGGGLGFLFGLWGTQVLTGFASSSTAWDMDRRLVLSLQPDARVFLFTVTLSMVTAILFGLAPAVRLASSRLASDSQAAALREQGQGLADRFRLRKTLVVAQVGLSLVLLIGAVLFVRTLINLKFRDLGIDREHTLLVWAATRQSGRQFGDPVGRLFEEAQRRVSALPGVISASGSNGGVLNGRLGFPYPVRVPGRPRDSSPALMAQTDMVMPGFFPTLGMRLQGRDFTSHDHENAPPVVIVNEAIAGHFFPGESPIGKRIGFGYAASGNEAEIVGVVSDASHLDAHEGPSRMMFYVPYRQDLRRLRNLCLVVRSAGSPLSVARQVRQELRAIDPNLPVLRMNTVDRQLDDLLVQERLIASLSGFFGGLAVLLTSLGLYGVMSYLTVRRTREIGVRLALGATPTGILGMVLRESLCMAGAGIVVGIAGSLVMARAISSALYGVKPADPLTIGLASLLMFVVAGLAGLLPARRASLLDPVVALRHD